MNRKKIIVIVVAIVLVLIILAKSKKTDEGDTSGNSGKSGKDTGNSSSGKNTGGSSSGSSPITDTDLNYVIGQFYEIFNSGTYDRERAQAVSLVREYIHSKADLKSLFKKFDSYYQTKFKQSFEQLVYSKIYGHGTYFEQLNQALANNGVDYQF